MLFNSYVFLFAFLPVMLLLWWQPRFTERVRLILLTVGSYIFYGYWDWRFVSLMVASTVIDYFAGLGIHRADLPSRRKLWLAVSLLGNLGLLGYFKYAGFFANTVNAVAGQGVFPVLSIVLPVGISFYTFQSLSYSIDIYRRKATPTLSFWHFSAYVAMFPQLIAGPIVRFTDIDQQLRSLPRTSPPDRIQWGTQLFVLGLCKKLLIADVIASSIDPLLAAYPSLGTSGAWLAMLGYTCQIYFDFSGYSDMAVGLGWLLGFGLPQNFDSPYKARDISDFWRRWHITLSRWLRDYLYIALGGSRGGTLATLRNLTLTMFLGGLWHGAAWTFVVWGLYHGALLVIFHLWRSLSPIRLPVLLGQAVTFVCVVVGWVFFRSESFAMAAHLLRSMFDPRQIAAASAQIPSQLVLMVGLGLGLCWFAKNTWEMRKLRSVPAGVALGVLLVVCVLRFAVASPFLYFQF